ncbi:ENV1 protein, partial [Ptilorrhoa leucosticta]|nr:ENV1 protein [Ptilorrhoa leucosticta]NXE44120.1 ENV1 protein [Ptilorrhoa leucosticta]
SSRSPIYGYKNAGDYCGTNITASQSSLGAYGAATHGGGSIWNNGSAKVLPPGVFLICGDRAWPGIPRHPVGGPCYLGKLSLFAPSQADLRRWKSPCSRRSIKALGPNCDDKVQLWGTTARVFASLWPGVGTAQALATINKLACWTVEQLNATTMIISQLAEDVNSLRHSVLQNRTATDFLLLAQRHGCEDFEGMCCFNLSDHNNSIHRQLQWLKQHTKNVTQVTSPFDTWLSGLFGGLSPWLVGLLKEVLRWILLLLVVIVCEKIV